MQSLTEAFLEGDHKRALELAITLQKAGSTAEDIVHHGIQPAMDALDYKCTVEHFNLLEIMLTGRAVSGVSRQIFPDANEQPNPRATVVVCSLEGDVHDIGKNILRMVLIGNRYKVVDCGKDVPVDSVLAKVKNSGAHALCVSGLITSVIPKVRTLRSGLDALGLADVLLLAGGAALKQSTAESLKVDFVGQTAFDASSFLNRFWKN